MKTSATHIKEPIPAGILIAVILTFNEKENIGRVLQKLYWLEKIIVVDSGSTDGTLEIIKSFSNTEIFYRKFDTHAVQWNYGLAFCNSEWILSLDADYILTQQFIQEIIGFIKTNNYSAFNAAFEFCVFGKPVGKNNTTPRPVLFRKSRCIYYDEGHTQRLKINGETGNFKNKILHDDRKPLTRWLINQASYSLKEAEMLADTSNTELPFIFKLRKTKIFTPFLVFFYCLFIQGLILKGWRGWHYTLQRTMVEMLIALRLIEKQLITKDS